MGDYFLGGGETSWMDLISQGISVTGSVLTNNPYYGPEDPRYRYPAPSTQQQQVRTGAAYPAGGYPSGGGNYQADTGAGIRLSNQTLIFIGIGVLAFMLGKRK